MKITPTFQTVVQAQVASITVQLDANEAEQLLAEHNGPNGPHTGTLVNAVKVALAATKPVQVPT
jgi:hypothetical protein